MSRRMVCSSVLNAKFVAKLLRHQVWCSRSNFALIRLLFVRGLGCYVRPELLVRDIRFQWYFGSCALLLSACNGAAASPSIPEPAPAAPESAAAEGVFKLKPESRQYVEVSTTALDDTPSTLRAPAHVAFKDGAVAQIGAPIEGRVTTIHVKVGDSVKRGDPLVTLQSPAAASARADLSAARLALQAASMGVTRQTQMLKDGVGIASEKFQADIELEKAKADLARAERTSGYLGDGAGASVVVRAPMDGSVLERKTTLGAVVDPKGETLLAIGDPKGVWVVADVFETDLPRIQPGAKVELELSTLGTPVHGAVQSIGKVVSSGLRSAPVYVELQDPPADLRAGMFARARISAEVAHAVTLPVSAVLIKDGKHSVVLVETAQNQFTEREVATGQPAEGRVPITSGLQPGDQVVTKGALLIDSSGEQLL